MARLVSSRKQLDPLSWMGCRIAVYDFTVQAKAERGGENSSPICGRRRNRRGCRAGVRRSKRRRVVAAAPKEELPLHPPSASERRREKRLARFNFYVHKSVSSIVKRQRLRFSGSDTWRDQFFRLVKAYRLKTRSVPVLAVARVDAMLEDSGGRSAMCIRTPFAVGLNHRQRRARYGTPAFISGKEVLKTFEEFRAIRGL